MKLTVKNFGPIREADVVVGPMTVFVGPSNTGKSYLAGLVYAVVDVLNKATFEISLNRFFSPKTASERAVLKQMRDELAHAQPSAEKLLPIVEKLFVHWANFASELWKEKIIYCFGEEGKRMLNSGDLVVKISDTRGVVVLDLCSPVNSELQSKQKQHVLQAALKSVQDGEKTDDILDFFILLLRIGQKQKLDKILITILKLAVVIFPTFGELLQLTSENSDVTQMQSHYLPASRGGIMQSHRALVESVFRQAPMAGLRKGATLPSFTGIFSDFVTKLVTMLSDAQTQRNSDAGKKTIATIGKTLEKEILAGEIKIKMSETKYPDFRYAFKRNGGTHEVPLMNASSMVAELTPLSIFMRYYVTPGDLFIIEEPESHLHPGAQREIANILVQLVHAGVHVMITTHSDTLIEQISNYALAFDVDKKVQGISLDKKNIAAYLFGQPKKDKQKNTKVTKISFKKDYGFLTKDHLDVSSKLYNESVRLFNAGESAVKDSKKNA